MGTETLIYPMQMNLSIPQSNNNVGNGITNLANGTDDSPIEAFDPFNANWAARLAKDGLAKEDLTKDGLAKDVLAKEPAKIQVTNHALLTTNYNAKNPFAQDVIAKTFE